MRRQNTKECVDGSCKITYILWWCVYWVRTAKHPSNPVPGVFILGTLATISVNSRMMTDSEDRN